MLRQGYAVASRVASSVFGNNCNDLLASETMMMVKERFVEAYGPPKFTMGWGCSGGSYQQLQTGDNFPGLIDGHHPCRTFPDVGFGTDSDDYRCAPAESLLLVAAPNVLHLRRCRSARWPDS